LSKDEKLLFRRIGVFASTFDLKAVASIASDAILTPGDVVGRLSDLVTKSPVTVYLDTPIPRFRMIETTRAYALEQLEASGEHQRLLRRGAEYARDRLERPHWRRGLPPICWSVTGSGSTISVWYSIGPFRRRAIRPSASR
jgi:predicted ATPase